MDRLELHPDSGCQCFPSLELDIAHLANQCFLLCYGQILLIFKRKYVYSKLYSMTSTIVEHE